MNSLLAMQSTLLSKIMFIVVAVLTVLLLGYKIFSVVKMQIRYRKAIKLIQLKSKNIGYLIIAIVLVPCLIISSIFIAKLNMLSEMICLVVTLSCIIASLTIISFSKCAIVDTGVYTPTKFISWANMYDYYINREKQTIMFSSNMKGGLTLVGTTMQLNYNKDEEEKIIFILENNKNRFLDNVVLR